MPEPAYELDSLIYQESYPRFTSDDLRYYSSSQ